MMKFCKVFSVAIFGAILATQNGFCEELTSTKVVTQQQAKVTTGDGWVFYEYFTTDTYGTQQALTGMAVIQPGKEIHPPHEHFEEEYLAITQGSGVWTIEGVDSPAKTGDIIYAAPWESHGIRNTGTEQLIFVVMKWQSKGVATPSKPK